MNVSAVFRKKVTVSRAAGWVWALVRTVLMTGVAFVIVYPVLFKFSVSLRSYSDSFDPMVFFVPRNPTFANFRLAFSALEYPKTALFSLLFCASTSILQAASCTMAAYSFSRFKYFGRNLLFALSIVTLVIPPQVLLLPLFIKFHYFNPLALFRLSGTFTGLNLIDTPIPFLLLSITCMGFKNGLYIYMLRQYFINVPNVLEEAANIDGCGTWKIFYKIMLPGAMPMLMSVFLFSFVWQWNDYYYTAMLAPNLQLLTTRIFTSVESIFGGGSDYWRGAMASPKILLLMAPLILLYIFTQRFFVESIEKSGIVG